MWNDPQYVYIVSESVASVYIALYLIGVHFCFVLSADEINDHNEKKLHVL